jgi:hypothetical protein
MTELYALKRRRSELVIELNGYVGLPGSAPRAGILRELAEVDDAIAAESEARPSALSVATAQKLAPLLAPVVDKVAPMGDPKRASAARFAAEHLARDLVEELVHRLT